MLEAVQRILKKWNGSEDAYSEMRHAQHKTSYTTWGCKECSSIYFYKVISCPLCESHDIEEVNHPVAWTKSVIVTVRRIKETGQSP